MFIKYFFIWILLSLPLAFAGYLVWFMSRGDSKKKSIEENTDPKVEKERNESS